MAEVAGESRGQVTEDISGMEDLAGRGSGRHDVLVQELMELCRRQADEAGRREDKLTRLLERVLDAPIQREKQPEEAKPVPITARISVNPPQLSAGATVAEFVSWKEAWHDFCICQKLDLQDDGSKVATLRQCLDDDLKRFIRQGVISIGIHPNIEDYVQSLEAYIRKQRNLLLDRIDFYQYHQDDGESFNTFLATLKDLHNACDFPINLLCTDCARVICRCSTCRGAFTKIQDELMRDRIVIGVNNDETRHKLLSVPALTLDEAVRICESEEAAQATQDRMHVALPNSHIQAIRKSHYQRHKGELSTGSRARTGSTGTQRGNGSTDYSSADILPACSACGYKHAKESRCPAKDRTCRICGLVGHFQKVCTQKRKRMGRLKLHRMSRMVEGTIELIVTPKDSTKSCRLQWLPDTGSEVDAAGRKELKHLGYSECDLEPDSSVVTNADGGFLRSLGKVSVTLTTPTTGAELDTTLHIYEGVEGPLLSLSSLKALQFLPREWPHQCARISLDPADPPRCPSEKDIDVIKTQLMDEFADVFDSSSSHLKAMNFDPMDIRLKPDARPFRINTARTIPHSYRDQVKNQLDEMVRKGIIETVSEPSEWCHPIVVVSKKCTDEKRLTVDLTKLNRQVERPVHPSTTPKDAISNVEKAKYFTVLDARHGYWQVPLKESVRSLTTFITPWGRYRYLRNPQGFIAAGDEYNRRTDLAFQGIEHMSKVVDDCLLYDEDFNSHVQRIRDVLIQAREHGITFSEKKFTFAESQVHYCGYLVSSDGWTMDPEKTRAIQDFPAPVNRTDLRSFMGLVNQFSEFTPSLASSAEPLRGLLKEKAEFLWLPEHTDAMKNVKEELLKPPVLAFYRLGAPLRLETDASRTQGLGFVLLQLQDEEWRLIQCGSRFITETEARYAMIELECLAVVWAIHKCHTFLAGTEFTVVTDHKPLVPIFNRYTLDQIENPRLLRLVMRLQLYQFTCQWRKGKDHFIADALSRAPVDDPTPEEGFGESIEFPDSNHPREFATTIAVVRCAPDSLFKTPDLKHDILCKAIASDGDYQKLLQVVGEGFPDSHKHLPASVQQYWCVREHLSVQDGVVLKGNCIVVPRTLRRMVLEDLHASHQGLERTKRRARQTVYWPNISNDINNIVRSCAECRKRQASCPKEPLLSEPEPEFPFQVASADLFSCQGNQYLVYVDHKSGWPCVYRLGNVATSVNVISPLRGWFAEVGVPEKLRTDGGPQFSSKRFADFCKRWQIYHQKSTPHYPQSNGCAEAAVKAVKSLIYKTTTDGDVDTDAFQRGLLEWRNTPRANGLSPAQMLFGRPLASFVFANHRLFSEEYQANADKADNLSASLRKKSEDCYNRTAHPLVPLRIGTKVDVQDHRTKKWTSPGAVVAVGRNRDYYIRMPSGRVYWRNRRFLRPYMPAVSTQLSTTISSEQAVSDTQEHDLTIVKIPEPEEMYESKAEEPKTHPEPQESGSSLRCSSRERTQFKPFDISSTKGQSYK